MVKVRYRISHIVRAGITQTDDLLRTGCTHKVQSVTVGVSFPDIEYGPLLPKNRLDVRITYDHEQLSSLHGKGEAGSAAYLVHQLK